MVGQPFGRFSTDPGKAGELVNHLHDGIRKVVHLGLGWRNGWVRCQETDETIAAGMPKLEWRSGERSSRRCYSVGLIVGSSSSVFGKDAPPVNWLIISSSPPGSCMPPVSDFIESTWSSFDLPIA